MGKEKKEIGIEKLIELLNEYEKKRIEKINSEGKLFVKLQFKPYTEESLTSKAYKSCWLEICSKQYGFIKWLVENDKIDLGEKLFNLTKNDNRKSIICDLDNNDFSWEDTFLMLLSISSSPIEDLLLYLK